jgi:predicted ATPase
MLLGWADAMAGDRLGAERIRTALTAFQATGARLSEPYFLALLAEAELLHGRPDVAIAIADDGVLEMTRGSRTFFAAPELHRIEAKALVMCGRDDEAREHINTAVRLAQELRSPVLELRALIEVARAGIGGTPSRTRLAELVEQITGDGASDDLVEARTLVARSP